MKQFVMLWLMGLMSSLTWASHTGPWEISNVLVGEVWICSGQSNMQFPASAVPNVIACTIS